MSVVIIQNITYEPNKLGFELGSDLVNEYTTSVRNLVNGGPLEQPGCGHIGRQLHDLWSVLTHLNTAQVLGRGLPSYSAWGHGGVVQGFPRWASRSLHGGSGRAWRAGGAAPQVCFARGTGRSQVGTSNDVSRRRSPHLQCISAKKRTEWLIAAGWMFVGYRGMGKLYLYW